MTRVSRGLNPRLTYIRLPKVLQANPYQSTSRALDELPYLTPPVGMARAFVSMCGCGFTLSHTVADSDEEEKV